MFSPFVSNWNITCFLLLISVTINLPVSNLLILIEILSQGISITLFTKSMLVLFCILMIVANFSCAFKFVKQTSNIIKQKVVIEILIIYLFFCH